MTTVAGGRADGSLASAGRQFVRLGDVELVQQFEDLLDHVVWFVRR